MRNLNSITMWTLFCRRIGFSLMICLRRHTSKWEDSQRAQRAHFTQAILGLAHHWVFRALGIFLVLLWVMFLIWIIYPQRDTVLDASPCFLKSTLFAPNFTAGQAEVQRPTCRSDWQLGIAISPCSFSAVAHTHTHLHTHTYTPTHTHTHTHTHNMVLQAP